MDVRQLSFRLLQVYVQVVRLGSVTAAAKLLHLTQPTVSLQLKKLTETVGAPLLEYQAQQLHPTHVGLELYQAACDVLGRFDDFQSFLCEERDGNTGQISLGIVTTAKYVIPQILGAFYRAYPKITVTVNVGNRAHILSRFERQQDDLYLFSHPPAGHTMQAARILKNPLQLIAPPDHWAVGQADLTFSQVQQERFLIREPGSATRLMFESWLSSQGFGLVQTMQIESNEAIRLSVAAGLGLSVISAHTLGQQPQPCAVLPVAGFPLESHWYLVRRKDRRLDAAARQLIRFIGEHLADCVDPRWMVPDLADLHLKFD
ncbi:MAG: LysR family transcriptional regulator [Gammaproteobacteria bacterium]|jgi:LysR family transcriptional regulator, low CO2-responsive transcriptional regulator|nr:LysR family transcriptional regulator [Gammaproteobacteria bacterium]MBU2180699.1 LysR family transcriptional regulator [Gammaproteobacteria bacterium]MBU2280512.1 LysR family transcriptional regulator [Gammaproteobacteria bacterium]MBU2429033.1 LysR family transcriptional regulator [Gammaproteobacteria bacterium]